MASNFVMIDRSEWHHFNICKKKKNKKKLFPEFVKFLIS